MATLSETMLRNELLRLRRQGLTPQQAQNILAGKARQQGQSAQQFYNTVSPFINKVSASPVPAPASVAPIATTDLAGNPINYKQSRLGTIPSEVTGVSQAFTQTPTGASLKIGLVPTGYNTNPTQLNGQFGSAGHPVYDPYWQYWNPQTKTYQDTVYTAPSVDTSESYANLSPLGKALWDLYGRQGHIQGPTSPSAPPTGYAYKPYYNPQGASWSTWITKPQNVPTTGPAGNCSNGVCY